jgi:hypothetical protein
MTEDELDAANERIAKWLEGYSRAYMDRNRFYCPMIEQFCRDLNEAHNEILRAQGVAEKDFNHYDWPEWSPQANSIRWAEDLLKKRLAKSDNWTRYPAATSQDERPDRCGLAVISAESN